MKKYTYFDGGKWRLKIGDTEYSGDWVDRLAAYEETGLEPEDMKREFNEDAVLSGAYVPKTITNADCIRKMSDDELAKFLATKLNDDFYGCPDLILQWLQQPAEEEV